MKLTFKNLVAVVCIITFLVAVSGCTSTSNNTTNLRKRTVPMLIIQQLTLALTKLRNWLYPTRVWVLIVELLENLH